LTAESGLHYNRYRYYDPHAGRYISPDPIGVLGGLNPYGYSTNPKRWIDPLGLLEVDPHTLNFTPADRLVRSLRL
jgi:RHS repeat-associated protein